MNATEAEAEAEAEAEYLLPFFYLLVIKGLLNKSATLCDIIDMLVAASISSSHLHRLKTQLKSNVKRNRPLRKQRIDKSNDVLMQRRRVTSVKVGPHGECGSASLYRGFVPQWLAVHVSRNKKTKIKRLKKLKACTQPAHFTTTWGHHRRYDDYDLYQVWQGL